MPHLFRPVLVLGPGCDLFFRAALYSPEQEQVERVYIVGGMDARRCDRGAAVDHAAAVNWYQFGAGLLLGLGGGILIVLLTIRRPNHR